MIPDSRIHIYSCGRAVHTKPYRSSGSVMQHYLLRLQAESSSIATLNGTSHHMASRDLVICRPGDHYRLYIGPEDTLDPHAPMLSVDYYVRCSGAWIDQWLRPGDPSVLHVGTDERIVGLFHSLVQERRNVMEPDLDILDHWMRLLLLHLRRLIDRRVVTASDPSAYIPYKMKAFIEKNATEPLTLEAIAASVGLGKSRASELFRRTFGQSVVDYAIEVRLSVARERMAVEGLSLEEVAYSCGFHTYSHFSRTFSARYGMSPRAYRQLHV
ncbi:MAG: AraC family transcriptional regulator [Paenibacillus sp.]|jgi:AraC family transcriptional regulator of arabinose operon|nr:AraC family transcriptional regulator [Paenibacillus sp.]